MKTFYILQKQFGSGCDYTIGCGKKWDIIQAENIEQAKKNFIWKKFRERDISNEELSEKTQPYQQCEDYGLAEVVIIEATNVLILKDADIVAPINELWLHLRKEVLAQEAKEKEKEEKQEYERLRKKFETKTKTKKNAPTVR